MFHWSCLNNIIGIRQISYNYNAATVIIGHVPMAHQNEKIKSKTWIIENNLYYEMYYTIMIIIQNE